MHRVQRGGQNSLSPATSSIEATTDFTDMRNFVKSSFSAGVNSNGLPSRSAFSKLTPT